MKTGRSLPELAYELERQARIKQDFLVSATKLEVLSNGSTHLKFNDHSFSLTDIAHSQLAEYLSIPKQYYDRMKQEFERLTVPFESKDSNDWVRAQRSITSNLIDRNYESDTTIDSEQSIATFSSRFSTLTAQPLFDVTLNSIFRSKADDQRLVRTLDGNARAFLSDSFNPDLDNYDVFRVAAKVIDEAGLGPEHVLSAEVTERKLYLKVVSPKLEAVIYPNNLASANGMLHEPQVVQAGFMITNSETGLGSLCVQQVVFKLMCKNMWVKEEAYRQRHIGKTLETDHSGGIYRSDTRLADAKARLLKLRDQVTDALNEHKFMQTVMQMQTSTEVRLDHNLPKVMEATAKRFGLSQYEKDEVMNSLIAGADLSLWGLSNAITATAQTVESYDRSTEMEAIGSKLFSLPKDEMKEIVRA